MICHLRYGASGSLELAVDDDALVAYCDAPRGEALRDVSQAVEHALREPLGFPPLAKSVVPGDKVVLALAEQVPQAAAIVQRVIEVLAASGIEARDVTLLRAAPTGGEMARDFYAELPPNLRSEIVGKLHDPSSRDSLSYLAATTDGKPIYLNRAIHDADFVISIGALRLADSLGYYGINSGVFPVFSDLASIERYRSPRAGSAPQRDRLRKDADEVGWLLGARFTIQVVPGAGDEILHVLAGDQEAVFLEGSRRCEEAWNYQIPRRADLIVATIEGPAESQTWDDVARALAAASESAGADGAVAICCELSHPPGPAMRLLTATDNLDEALKIIGQQKLTDALLATELVRALKRGKVYLTSRLNDELVEDLGMLPVSAGEISRLAKRYDSCIVLTNAQYAIAHPRGEQSSEPVRAKSKPRK
jgi:nickel-dependent lactate racemase